MKALTRLLIIIVGNLFTSTQSITAERQSAATARFSFTEELPINTSVGSLSTYARSDSTCTDQVSQFRLARPSRFFSVSEQNGTIYSIRRVDRESLLDGNKQSEDASEVRCNLQGSSCSVTLQVWIHERCRDVAANQILVIIEINDINDNEPRWNIPSDSLSLRYRSGRTFEQWRLPIARDADQGENGRVTYSLEGADDETSRSFQLVFSNSTPQLAIRRPLTRPSYRLRLIAVDSGSPRLSGTLSIRVSLNEASDSPPRFDHREYVVHVSEDEPVNFIVCTIEAHDNDTDQTLVYSIGTAARLRERENLPFEVEPTGIVRLTKPIDHELRKEYTIDVQVSDGSYTDVATLKVLVDDVNDNSPEIALVQLGHADTSGDYTLSVAENVAHQEIGLLQIHDADSGENGRVECQLVKTGTGSALPNVRFTLLVMPSFNEEANSPIFAQLVADGDFDREIHPLHTIIVECVDKAEKQPRQSYAVLTIRVEDTNDNPPIFNQSAYTVHVKENSQTGKVIAQFVATDADMANTPNSNVTYSLRSTTIDISKYLRIEELTGIVRAKQPLDRETLEKVHFSVVATDAGVGRLSSSAEVLLVIDDIDDNAPVFQRSRYHFFVNENDVSSLPIGRVNVLDEDQEIENTHVFYQLEDVEERDSAKNHSYASHFRIDDEGQLYVLRELDAELSRKITLKVLASNSNDFRRNASATLTIYVNDANDNAPEFVFPNRTVNAVYIAPVPAGHEITVIKAIDADVGRNSEIVYTLLNANGSFYVDETTGQLRALVDFPANTNSFHKLLIRATDRGNPQQSKFATLNLYVLYKLETTTEVTSVSEATSEKLFTSWIATHQTVVFVSCLLSVLCTLTIGVSITVFWSRLRKHHRDSASASAPNGGTKQLNEVEVQMDEAMDAKKRDGFEACHIVSNALSNLKVDSASGCVSDDCCVEIYAKHSQLNLATSSDEKSSRKWKISDDTCADDSHMVATCDLLYASFTPTATPTRSHRSSCCKLEHAPVVSPHYSSNLQTFAHEMTASRITDRLPVVTVTPNDLCENSDSRSNNSSSASAIFHSNSNLNRNFTVLM